MHTDNKLHVDSTTIRIPDIDVIRRQYSHSGKNRGKAHHRFVVSYNLKEGIYNLNMVFAQI